MRVASLPIAQADVPLRIASLAIAVAHLRMRVANVAIAVAHVRMGGREPRDAHADVLTARAELQIA
jgi:hypothetical protein